jgi:hypothetical protein
MQYIASLGGVPPATSLLRPFSRASVKKHPGIVVYAVHPAVGFPPAPWRNVFNVLFAAFIIPGICFTVLEFNFETCMIIAIPL